MKYLKKEKVTKSKKPVQKKLHSSENASRAGILPTKNSDDKVVVNKSQSILEETIVSPELPKSTVTIIRPTTMQKEESLTAKAAGLMESMKEKTEEAIDSIKSATGQGVSRTVSNIVGSEPLVIPIIEQKSSSETKSYTEEIIIEKRLVERKKNIEVKVTYEEIFVNGKEIGSSVGDVGDTFRGIKDKILEIVSFEKDRDEKELEKMKGDMIPLLENSRETEKMIPLYAEEVIISKRMVKVADLIIRKRNVTETSKIDVDFITEELTVKNPTGGGKSS
jgi:stress response protein YsnF